MTATSLALTAITLALLPSRSPVASRLAWLAGRRWQPEAVVDHGRSRWWSVLRTARWSRPILVAPAGAVPVAILVGPIPGVLALLAAAVAVRSWRLVRAERAQTAELAAMAAAVSALAAEHAAGATLGAALVNSSTAAGRHQDVMRRAGRLAELGREPAAAMADQPALARIAVAIGLVSRTGTATGEVLRRARADLVALHRGRTAVAEAVAGARASALLLAGLPVAGLAMGAALGAHPLRTLLHTTPGLAALTAGVLLNLAGVLWTVRLTTPGPAAAAGHDR